MGISGPIIDTQQMNHPHTQEKNTQSDQTMSKDI